MITRDEIVEIGKFQKTHALKGELNALLDIDFDYATDGHPLVVEMDGIYVPFYAESVRPKGSESSLIKLADIDSLERAQEFVNKTIYGLRSDLLEYYDDMEDEVVADFIDYLMVDEQLGEIGKIVDIDDTTANVLFVVETPYGQTVYVPVADEFITAIDAEDRKVFTRLPDGLIDLNKK